MTAPTTKYKLGERVYVPSHLLPNPASYPFAMVACYVDQVQPSPGRSIQVKTAKGGFVSGWIASSRAVADPSVLLIKIGDYDEKFETETTLLDPLAQSATQFLRLLLPDDMLLRRDLRSVAELEAVWKRDSPGYRNVVLIGHGATDGIVFGVDRLVTVNELSSVFTTTTRTWSFLSLCCLTGYKDFSKPFSALPACAEFIAPFHSVHGAVASQFLQALFVCRLYRGESPKVSFRHADDRIPADLRFRRWVNGSRA